MAASGSAGKHMLAAPLYKPAPKEVQNTKTIDEQFAVLRACFGITDPPLQTSVLQQPATPLANKTKANQEDWPSLQAQMDSRPQQISDGPTATRHVPLTPA